MKLEIMILSMPSRAEFRARLMANLNPQLNEHVKVSTRMCDPAYTLGENRELMRQLSVGDYIVFIDDDDLVADDYISSILPLLDGVDQVGFQVQCYIDGKPLPQKTYHSLQYKEWSEDGNGYYRDISHINPMRWQIATIERIEGGHGEDKRWADRMRGKVKTEHYIDRVMYHYYFRTRKNMAGACINCQSTSTVIVEDGSFCNACGVLFNPVPKRRSCLWA